MPNLSIKDVPEALAEKLRQRAARNHRSLQGELMALLEVAGAASTLMAEEPVAAYAAATRPPASHDAAVFDPADDLLAQLDAIVADSQWGSGPWLTREQIHDRRLMRELEYEQRREEALS